LPIEYFKYPDPQIVAVVPSQGLVAGGSTVSVEFRDFSGAMTRQAARMLSLHDSLLPARKEVKSITSLSSTFRARPAVRTQPLFSCGWSAVRARATAQNILGLRLI